MPNIYVADVMCGGGKTSAAISFINNSHTDAKFIFITPYLPECVRIIQSCTAKNFVQPQSDEDNKGIGQNRVTETSTKLQDMRLLLEQGKNIASTHALFPRYTDDMLCTIREKHYTMIIDEAYAMTQVLPVEERILFKDEVEKGSIVVHESGRSEWVAPKPGNTSPLYPLYQKMENGSVYQYGSSMLVWLFPERILDAFSDIIVLTYMFKAQPFRYYLDLLQLPYQYIGTKQADDRYVFCSMDDEERLSQRDLVRGKIHILDNKKLNAVGDAEHALSATWFKRNTGDNESASFKQLARNIRNVQKNIFRCSTSDFIWTVYKSHADDVSDKNIRNRFVSWSTRATNQYGKCHYMAYGVNIHAQPEAYRYFQHCGIAMDVQNWALSEMIQWIWRSAIRNGEDVWIYLPSSRMRHLLENWLNDMTDDTAVA